MSTLRFFGAAGLAAVAAFALSAVPASATTLNEYDVTGGEFSADFRAPTLVGTDVTSITGVGGNSSDDYFLFSGLEGGDTLTLSFSAPSNIGYSYSAGGVALWSDAAFRYEWDGARIEPQIQLDWATREQSLSLTLPDDFLGSLYLALNFTHGENLTYSIDGFRASAGLPTTGKPAPGVPAGGSVVDAAVPAPAPLLLLGSSLIGLGALRRRAGRPAA